MHAFAMHREAPEKVSGALQQNDFTNDFTVPAQWSNFTEKKTYKIWNTVHSVHHVVCSAIQVQPIGHRVPGTCL